MLLPMLVRFFEAEMRDMNNRIAVRRKAEDLHAKLEDPLFSLYLIFSSANSS